MMIGAFYVVALLHAGQGDLPRLQNINIAGIKNAGTAVASGTAKVEAESGISVETSTSQQIQGCLALKEADPESSTVCVDALQKKLAYSRDLYTSQSGDLQYRRDAFEWQLFSSKIVFVAVLLVVFSGLVFAAIQFYLDYRAKTIAQPQVSSVGIGKDGVTVSSPVLGVIVLVISVTFLYMYLQFVYPIHEL